KSTDGGNSWVNTDLERSEHIGRILVDPRDSATVFVAAEGPLWSSGGERGVYRTTDGGDSWEAVLTLDEDTGVTDIAFHPANPDVIYAAAYQRRRHVWGFLAGGPQGGIYKSVDGGESWTKKTRGLPRGDVGKIGLAVTAADPERVYATIEATSAGRGFYRSTDAGESWSKRNGYISGGTGPHYYQELVASQRDADLVFQMDVFMRVTRDGGNTFDVLGNGREKHSDNHMLWIDPNDDRHLLAGTDAGLYESFDQGEKWRHFPNLPVSQFYKVAVDNALPFYNVLVGAQDLGTVAGPSRTLITEGIRNQDWFVPLGADGYGVAFDPSDNDIAYMEYQQGVLFRYHRDTGELVPIQPQPAPDEPAERWNWDTPILLSPHDPARLYVGSQRLWRSDDRGGAWQAVSGDLTDGDNRYELPYYGRTWSVDALHDNRAMSKYATLTTITESPQLEGLLYVGSDDGLIHVSGDGGENWRRAADLPGIDNTVFVNDLEASLHDADTVFAVVDAHKFGAYAPHVFVSRNRGQRWRSIVGDLPEDTIVWSIQQDHEDPDLLFVGAEDGVHVTVDGGAHWHRLGGAPRVPFRDLKLQRRDNDLVGASFGRGVYVLADSAPLRTAARSDAMTEATVFPVRDAWWYVPSVPSQAVGMPTFGSDSFRTPNPDFGALITYYLPDARETLKDARGERERALRDDGSDVPFPGWAALRAESEEAQPRVLMLVKDAAGEPVRWLQAANAKGVHRITWDLRLPPPDAIDLSEPGFTPPWVTDPIGPLVAPGRYSVQLYSVSQGAATALGDARDFTVKPAHSAPPGVDYVEVARYQQQCADLLRDVAAAREKLNRTTQLLTHMQAAALQARSATPALFVQLDAFSASLGQLQSRLSGDAVRQRLAEATAPSIARRAAAAAGSWNTTQPATATQRRDYDVAQREFSAFRGALATLINDELPALEAALTAAGAPSW
ncbi:MAG: glycosyl hydrolase, partial [Pseudomonadota bacterium]